MAKVAQKERVLDYIRNKGFITSRDAGLRLDIWDLQGCIRDLKNDGYEILSDWYVSKKTKARYKVYVLKKKEFERYRLLFYGK